ncbi:EamA family transporter RarD [Sporosarcina trichiuri]|uniref:EamA family transporter RarD n=1 Tax=Sporosarcina trichiuri TaxID=3056445 RepID=UPI0025B5B6B8|nr:EamA family transporter RarD [Sporosarcina sp. 0.2-SM1T-5]WJY27960.1 EamA family transporter RarD [Sporosarcina sp. 0.2-SM1T-5]
MQSPQQGAFWVFFAYFLWGFMPIYWKSLDHVGSSEILLNRIIWAFILTAAVLLIAGQGRKLAADVKELWRTPRQFWGLCLASLLVTTNWGTYIWAVNHDFIVQASLGYYMNPLVSVLLGILFLKESLNRSQQGAFVLAAVGVTILTIHYGVFPWVSFVLALSFALYGLIKKHIKLDAARGLAIETAFVVPIALLAYGWLIRSGDAVLFGTDPVTVVLLVLTGIATALPLIFFSKGVVSIPLYVSGFLQYIAPTLMLIIGVSLYGEQFGAFEWMSFAFIWAALMLFTIPQVVRFLKNRRVAGRLKEQHHPH